MVTDALQWILLQQGIRDLDDFRFVEPPEAPAVALETARAAYVALGIPITQEMLEGPVTTITFLGIELDSVRLVACLPADKLARVWQLVSELGYKKVCTKWDPTKRGHGGTVWLFLLAPDNRPIHHGTGTAPSHSLEQGVPLRPAVVDTVLSQVEWEQLLFAGSPGTP